MLTFKMLAILAVLFLIAGVIETEDSNDCVSEQELADELAAVKDETQKKVNELHSQLQYLQNVTINVLKTQCPPANTDTEKLDTVIAITVNVSSRLDSLEDSLFKISNVNETVGNFIDPALNYTEKLDTVIAITEKTSSRLDSLEDSLLKISQTNDTIGSFLNPAHNCSHILSQHPGSSSGYYWIQSSPGYAVKVYCDMERVCGCGEGGGWMRVADIDMTRPNQTCPTGFRQITTTDGKTICGGQSEKCVNTSFSTHGLQYSRVCGRIVGYQFGTPDSFNPYIRNATLYHFVDGIILTRGALHSHVWIFAAGWNQYRNDDLGCPCNAGYNAQIPPFVGNDFFCDSGFGYSVDPGFDPPSDYFTSDPLWDGQGCLSGSCCSFNNPPWFCKELTTPTTDNIDLSLCLDETTENEDVLFEVVELYTQ